jgi:hypothetical protein
MSETRQEKEAEPSPPKKSEGAHNSDLNNILLEKWIDISVETDRQLLTLSTGGIGLIAAFITTKGVGSAGQMALLILAFLCFLATLTSIFYILYLNKKHIASIMAGGPLSNSLLGFLDKFSVASFSFGVILSAVFAFNVASTDLVQKPKESIQCTEQINERSENRHPEKPSGSACGCNFNEREPKRLSILSNDAKPEPTPESKPASRPAPKPRTNSTRCDL